MAHVPCVLDNWRYKHRLRILLIYVQGSSGYFNDPETDNQTAEHILLECAILKEDRERLIAAVAKEDNWPINKETLITKN